MHVCICDVLQLITTNISNLMKLPGSAGDSGASARLRGGVRPGVTAAGGRIVGYPMPEVISSSLEFGL